MGSMLRIALVWRRAPCMPRHWLVLSAALFPLPLLPLWNAERVPHIQRIPAADGIPAADDRLPRGRGTNSCPQGRVPGGSASDSRDSANGPTTAGTASLCHATCTRGISQAACYAHARAHASRSQHIRMGTRKITYKGDVEVTLHSANSLFRVRIGSSGV